jgi:hypothetical protein
VSPNPSGNYAWAFCNPPNVPVIQVPADVVAIEWSPVSGFVCQSPVRYILARL